MLGKTWRKAALTLIAAVCLTAFAVPVSAVPKGPYPPENPDIGTVATDRSAQMLKMPAFAKDNFTGDYTIARTAPVVDFTFFPQQDHIGNPWSDWGDATVAPDGKLYVGIGDHKWEAYVYEYDPETKTLRTLVDIKKWLLESGTVEEGDYTPGKVHSLSVKGTDGWVYFATHRGSGRYTNNQGREKYNYKGDWVLRVNPESLEVQMVGDGPPIPYDAIPAGRLDPERLIWYGGTANDMIFFAQDCKTGKVLNKTAPGNGLYRYGFISTTNGKFYFSNRTRKKGQETIPQQIRSYDPATNQIELLDLDMQMRSATKELPGGIVYSVSHGGVLYRFNVQTEKARKLGSLSISRHDKYNPTLDASPDGKYIYYLGGGHGGIARDGTPIKQYNTETGAIKILCFLNDYYAKKYDYVPDGTFGMAVSNEGDEIYITMNGCKPGEVGARNWYACALFTIHIPESERP